jgi:Rrf2 family protein
MKLNTTSQYAIRIMTYIAKHSEKKFHKAKEISEALGIPYKYLTAIMTQLVNAKIITSVQGREGGYFLEKKPSTIVLSDILEAVNESLHGENCLLGIGACSENKKCYLHDKWKEPKQSIINMLKDTTLDDINKGDYKI